MQRAQHRHDNRMIDRIYLWGHIIEKVKKNNVKNCAHKHVVSHPNTSHVIKKKKTPQELTNHAMFVRIRSSARERPTEVSFIHGPYFRRL